MQSLIGRVSVQCLELLETVFDGFERLSRRAAGARQGAMPQTVADRAGDSQKAMQATAK
jgi:hypothetical protein